MQIQEIEIKDLKEYEENPRNNDSGVDAVAESIKEFGFKVPIIVDNNNVIVAGHTRLKAAKKLGLSKAPCIIADDLTTDQIKAFRIADNKTAELSEWDIEKLLSEIKDIDLDMTQYGFTDEELKKMEDKFIDSVQEDDSEIELPEEPKSKIGDLFLLGEHRLICGDSTDENTIKRLVGENEVSLYLTDPPYNVNYQGGTEDKLKIINDNFSTKDEFLDFLTKAFSAANSVMKNGAPFYIWHADTERINFQGACEKIGWAVRQNLVWIKNAFVMGRQDYQWKHEPCLYGWKDGHAHHFIDQRNLTTVLEFNRPTKNNIHPTMKPVELFYSLIHNSSLIDDYVLDSFGGSGTTIIACEQLKRKALVSEIDPRYCDAIINRWETFTGKKAVLQNK